MGEKRWELHPGDDLFPEMISNEETLHVDVLYGRGNPAVLHESCVSIVGARMATPYGLAVSQMAGRIAGESGIVVVSGGARGCDYAATRAALDAGGKTIIVAGSGADVVYPASSRDIFNDTIERGGAVISLEGWGKHPTRFSFPKRNVIIAALSSVLMVAEAGERSGTMSTADAAISLDRTIYAVPGSIFSPSSQGVNRLLCEGALPICSEVDLETRISMDYGVLRLVSEGVSPQMGEVISALVANPMRPDELAPRVGLEVLTLLRTLSDYESRGVVERLPDGRYSLTAQAYQDYRSVGSFAHRSGA